MSRQVNYLDLMGDDTGHRFTAEEQLNLLAATVANFGKGDDKDALIEFMTATKTEGDTPTTASNQN
jgi:hypothetical protein